MNVEHEFQNQETLNLSNDISQDLIELENDKQFTNAFKDGSKKNNSKKTTDLPYYPG